MRSSFTFTQACDGQPPRSWEYVIICRELSASLKSCAGRFPLMPCAPSSKTSL